MNTTFTRSALILITAVALVCADLLRADDWPQFRGPNRDAVWNETGIMHTFPAEGLKVRWRASIGDGHSSPVVAGGRVYVTDSLTDSSKDIARTWERVHCFDEMTGESLWLSSDEIGSGSQQPNNPQNPPKPVATPVVDAGLVFTLGLTGHLLCLDALKGALVWQKDLSKDYSLVEQPNHTSCPLIAGDLLIALIGGKPGACVVAFDKRTGKEVWRALDDPPRSFSSPIVISAGGQRQLIVWTPSAVTSLNPATGQTWWREELNTREDYAVATPVVRDDLMLISGLMFQLDRDKPAAKVLWPEKKPMTGRVLSHTSMPLILDGHVFAGKMGGRLICLEARSGKQLWETDKVTALAHCATIHLTLNGDSVLLFTDQGNLIRARLTATGCEELSRVHLIDPTYLFAGRKLVWAPPAFANRHVFARNDQELVCASLAVPEPQDASAAKPWRALPLITKGKKQNLTPP